MKSPATVLDLSNYQRIEWWLDDEFAGMALLPDQGDIIRERCSGYDSYSELVRVTCTKCGRVVAEVWGLHDDQGADGPCLLVVNSLRDMRDFLRDSSLAKQLPARRLQRVPKLVAMMLGLSTTPRRVVAADTEGHRNVLDVAAIAARVRGASAYATWGDPVRFRSAPPPTPR